MQIRKRENDGQKGILVVSRETDENDSMTANEAHDVENLQTYMPT